MIKFFQQYRAYVSGTGALPRTTFRSHVWRYRLLHSIMGVAIVLFGVTKLSPYMTVEALQGLFTRFSTGIEKLYPAGVEFTYDPAMGITTNATGPVIRSIEEVYRSFALDPSSQTGILGEPVSVKNALVIDTAAAPEDITSYETMMLLTDTHLVFRKENGQITLYPLISEDKTGEKITINAEKVATFISVGSAWITAEGPSVIRFAKILIALGGLFLIPLIALFVVIGITLGLSLMSFIGRLVSKFFVKISYSKMFLSLSTLYLVPYLIFQVLSRSSIGTPIGLKYLVMLLCFVLLIVREKEQQRQTK